MKPSCQKVISYSPIGDEPDPRMLGLDEVVFIVPPDKGADPAVVAAEAVLVAQGRSVCVLVPGRAFDRAGTRHGRGLGWYDHFLAALPHEWTKIGVTTPELLSATPLIRKSHDIPVDMLAIISDKRVEWTTPSDYPQSS